MTAIGRSETKNVINTSPFVVVLTVPSPLPPSAVQKLKEAAEQAGILDPRTHASARPTVLQTVDETEAAALAIYGDMLDNRSAFKACRHETSKLARC